MKNKVSFDVVKLVIYNNNKFLLQHRDDKIILAILAPGRFLVAKWKKMKI